MKCANALGNQSSAGTGPRTTATPATLAPGQSPCEKLVRHKVSKFKSYTGKCGKAAQKYRVEGEAFSAFATLCDAHAKAARAEGFVLSAYTLQESEAAPCLDGQQ